MGKLARRSANGQPSSPSPSVPAGSVLGAFPALIEFMSLNEWEDGTSRTPGTVMVLVDNGAWKVWLHDRDLSQGLFVSGGDPDEAFLRAEEALVSGQGDWRPDRGSRRK